VTGTGTGAIRRADCRCSQRSTINRVALTLRIAAIIQLLLIEVPGDMLSDVSKY